MCSSRPRCPWNAALVFRPINSRTILQTGNSVLAYGPLPQLYASHLSSAIRWSPGSALITPARASCSGRENGLKPHLVRKFKLSRTLASSKKLTECRRRDRTQANLGEGAAAAPWGRFAVPPGAEAALAREGWAASLSSGQPGEASGWLPLPRADGHRRQRFPRGSRPCGAAGC